jgi:predicted Fe-S protein YdhL (DUF1289 family)
MKAALDPRAPTDALPEAADGAQRRSTSPRSPCTSVCRMDAASGWCEGCLRTLDEIATWAALDDPAKRAVWVEIGRRRVIWRRRGARPATGADEA